MTNLERLEARGYTVRLEVEWLALEPAFTRAVRHVLELEGGYGQPPNDPGGETHYGISHRAYPWITIKALNRHEAISIYHRDYWLAMGCELLPSALGAKLLDVGVNVGHRAGIRLLQQGLCYLGRHLGQAVAVDGRMGPETIAAVAAVGEARARQALTTYQLRHYVTLVEKRPEIYGPSAAGWLARAFS